MELISKFLNLWHANNKSIFIHVIGDAMLDQDYEVKVSRISPECPNVNILLSETDSPVREHPGGAANTCLCLANLGVIARLFCFIDDDAFAVIRKNIKYWGYLSLPKGYYVPRKKRYYENGVQVARIDIERPNYGLNVKELQGKLLELYKVFQFESDGVIISDYGKGLFDNLGIKDFLPKCITVVDPKKAPIERWHGCTVFKPNKREAIELSGLRDWREQCDFFQKTLDCKAVIITQEGDGIVGKAEDYFEYKVENKVKPIDVLGGGDCYISVLTLALVLGFSYEEAAIIAFHAGLSYVKNGRNKFWSLDDIGK